MIEKDGDGGGGFGEVKGAAHLTALLAACQTFGKHFLVAMETRRAW
jgi:hypothetical protein